MPKEAPDMAVATSVLRVAGAPALAAYRDSPARAGTAGTILYYHGFGGGKEDARDALVALAEAGFLAVGLDNVGHGERRLPDFGRRFAGLGPGPELEAGFLALVRATAREVPTVLDDLLARGLARPDHLGVAGWSMGGFVAYAAVVADPRLRAAAPLLGAPAWRLPWPESPHRHLERFFPTALLSLDGGGRPAGPAAGHQAFPRGLGGVLRGCPRAPALRRVPGCRSRYPRGHGQRHAPAHGRLVPATSHVTSRAQRCG